MLDDYLKANLASWDEVVGLHVDSDLYDVAGFRAGKSSLSEIELEELGPFVGEGTTLLHLQCHFGLDTLSWARRGAVVTGVDFSGEGIRTARALADEVGLSARATFVQSDVENLPDQLSGSFDVVFTSWGALIWLGDLERWAEIVAHFLKPGGTFYIAEFHPYAFLLADDTSDALRIGYPYFMYGVPQRFDEPGDYADPNARTEHTVTFEWLHGFAEIIDPLLRRGLRFEALHELPYTVPGLPFRFLEKDDHGMLRLKGHHDDFPLTFTLRMTKERVGTDDGSAGGEAGGERLLGDEDLLAMLEEAITGERAAQQKYRRGLEHCADPAACAMFEQLLHEELAHERVLEARYAEVKKRLGLRRGARD